MKTLKVRVQKAKQALSFIGVTQRDKNGKPKTLIVPGSNGAKYQVILRRSGRVITAECAKELGQLGCENCKGNSHSLCYHSIAAIEFSLREAGFKSHWCETEEDAQRLFNALGGTIYLAKSHNCNAMAFILINKEAK